ncbi:hypothetical protein GP486_003458 [Trichoglossum hirsutum]|uniref:Beta-catenin-like protein 1 N-terminal domain-containing protein n=1 Tax=Trichoglossum hirsutum TaxID=265104 RepID=A0A9P8RQN2_9PEZI|nr:hypothetical protein GP486_003458 [Trichoglossum hirsutum]
MTSIDDLFKVRAVKDEERSLLTFIKKPALPGGKRKLEPTQDSNTYKSMKVHMNKDVKGKGQATVEDEEVGSDTVDSDGMPGYSAVELDEDEEGRFFGGGISKDTAEILDFMDGRDSGDTAPEKIDSVWLRKTALNFEKRISQNAELRAKFENNPEKFMSSEADLDADIKALSILSEHSELYAEFARLGCVNSLVTLLSHENTDIAIDAMEVIAELTDEDVEAEQEEWDTLVNAMLEADLLDLLTQNLSRFDESNESDRAGVYHALVILTIASSAVIENLASQQPISEMIAQQTSVMPWLLRRIAVRELPVTQNTQYTAEVLAILLQSSVVNRKRLIEIDGVDALLQLVSAYRKRDPLKGTEEEEFVENVFDCLTCVVREAEGKRKFVEAEGVELCLIMLREGRMSKPRALRLIDHAVGGPDGIEVCERLVGAAGLKTIFSMFMKKQDNNTVEHLLGIFAALLRALPANSAERIRALAKFVEKDYEKLVKLIKLRRDYASKVSMIDEEIKSEIVGMDTKEREDMSDARFSRRLDAGLFCLQMIDVILAWLIAEDDGVRNRVQEILADRDEDLSLIRATLEEQAKTMTEGVSEDVDSTMKDILSTLIRFL